MRMRMRMRPCCFRPRRQRRRRALRRFIRMRWRATGFVPSARPWSFRSAPIVSNATRRVRMVVAAAVAVAVAVAAAAAVAVAAAVAAACPHRRLSPASPRGARCIQMERCARVIGCAAPAAATTSPRSWPASHAARHGQSRRRRCPPQRTTAVAAAMASAARTACVHCMAIGRAPIARTSFLPGAAAATAAARPNPDSSGIL